MSGTRGEPDTMGRMAGVARRNPLPKGTMAVGVGLILSGITSYGFLSLSARALGPEEYAPLGLLWTAMFLLGPGLFLPVEQEVSRALAERSAQGEGGAPLDRAAELAEFLASAASDGITGRLLSALWDDWAELPRQREQLDRTDIYTLRRIVPADRKGA